MNEDETTPPIVISGCKVASMSSIKVLEQKDYMSIMQKDQAKSEDKERSGDVKMASSFED